MQFNIFSVHNYVTFDYGLTCILVVGCIYLVRDILRRRYNVIDNGLYLEAEGHLSETQSSTIQGQRVGFFSNENSSQSSGNIYIFRGSLIL